MPTFTVMVQFPGERGPSSDPQTKLTKYSKFPPILELKWQLQSGEDALEELAEPGIRASGVGPLPGAEAIPHLGTSLGNQRGEASDLVGAMLGEHRHHGHQNPDVALSDLLGDLLVLGLGDLGTERRPERPLREVSERPGLLGEDEPEDLIAITVSVGCLVVACHLDDGIGIVVSVLDDNNALDGCVRNRGTIDVHWLPPCLANDVRAGLRVKLGLLKISITNTLTKVNRQCAVKHGFCNKKASHLCGAFLFLGQRSDSTSISFGFIGFVENYFPRMIWLCS